MYLAIIVLPLLGSIASEFFGRKIGIEGAHRFNEIFNSSNAMLKCSLGYLIGLWNIYFNIDWMFQSPPAPHSFARLPLQSSLNFFPLITWCTNIIVKFEIFIIEKLILLISNQLKNYFSVFCNPNSLIAFQISILQMSIWCTDNYKLVYKSLLFTFLLGFNSKLGLSNFHFDVILHSLVFVFLIHSYGYYLSTNLKVKQYPVLDWLIQIIFIFLLIWNFNFFLSSVENLLRFILGKILQKFLEHIYKMTSVRPAGHPSSWDFHPDMGTSQAAAGGGGDDPNRGGGNDKQPQSRPDLGDDYPEDDPEESSPQEPSPEEPSPQDPSPEDDPEESYGLAELDSADPEEPGSSDKESGDSNVSKELKNYRNAVSRNSYNKKKGFPLTPIPSLSIAAKNEMSKSNRKYRDVHKNKLNKDKRGKLAQLTDQAKRTFNDEKQKQDLERFDNLPEDEKKKFLENKSRVKKRIEENYKPTRTEKRHKAEAEKSDLLKELDKAMKSFNSFVSRTDKEKSETKEETRKRKDAQNAAVREARKVKKETETIEQALERSRKKAAENKRAAEKRKLNEAKDPELKKRKK